MNPFRQIPFFRILLPFLAGLLLALKLQQPLPFLFALYFSLVFSLLIYFLWVKTRLLILFLIGCDGALLLFGMLLVQQNTLMWKPSYYGNVFDTRKEVVVLARLNDIPTEKPKTIKLKLEMIQLSQNGMTKRVEGKLLAYVKKQVLFAAPKAGDTILFRAQLHEIEPPANPSEFDYKRYLYNRQIYHQVFLDSSNDVLVQPGHVAWSALRCKQWLVDRLKTAGLTTEAFSICSALLTGYDEEIGQDILRAFAHSGTLHVLSVSGLHTGLIFACLSLVFDFFDRRRKHQLLKFVLLITVLWVFAFITGLEAPVLRSVVMLSLFAVGSVFFHNEPRNQVNLLLVSAFGLLCFQPYFLTDIGFQLSFSAIFGLIVFEPFMAGIWEPGSVVTNWLWKSTCASFAATLSTLPFTLYYFKQFPLWFFVANPVVVPASFVLLLFSIPALCHWSWVVAGINVFTQKLIAFIRVFDKTSLAYIEGINFGLPDALWITACIVLISLALGKRSYPHLLAALVVWATWQFSAAIHDARLRSEELLSIYSVNKATAVSVKQGDQFFYVVSDSSLVDRYLRPHAVSLGNPKLRSFGFNAVETENYQVLLLSQSGRIPLPNSLKPCVLVVCGNFDLKEELLLNFRQVKAVVIDRSNRRNHVRRIEKLCRKFGLLCFDTRTQGPCLMDNNEIKNWR